MMTNARDFDQAYLALHIPKEDLYWTTYMGIENRADELNAAELKLKNFASSPENLAQARAALVNAQSEKDKIALEGWVKFFESNTIESPVAQKIQGELIELESKIRGARAALEYTYQDSSGKTHKASTNTLSVTVTTNPDAESRRTAHEALMKLEQWVLKNGFIDQIKTRNRFAQAQGYPNYYAYKLMKNEGLTIEELDQIFEPFEKATRARMFDLFEKLANEKGAGILDAHQLLFSLTGELSAELDPFFPFSKSMARWGLTFHRLGIRFRGAELTLDLLDRKGKYENGFMHGPVPSFFDGDRWNPARINFTSNATPNQVGNGRNGLVTLFHEGGHAAHFSNVTQNSPCFSQEFPPTSMAYAETQSMFCDSLLGDADWMKRYARDRQNREIPDTLIKKMIEVGQPLKAYRERGILLVAIFERHLYEMKDAELTPENITRLARKCEKEIFGLNSVARPVLVVPHLLSESAAGSYQGYLLANMAVYQTRAHFKKKYGALTDEPRIGQDLADAYWSIGNRITHNETVKRLTGETISGQALANVCNLNVDEAWENAQALIASLSSRPEKGTLDDVNLDCRVRVIHGKETIAETKESFAQMSGDFEAWIEKHYPRLDS